MVRVRGSGSGAEVAGFLAPAALAPAALAAGASAAGARLHLLTDAGQTLEIALEEVLAVFFVSAFEPARTLAGSWTGPRSGARLPGLWVRVRGSEHTHWDGILASDLLDLAEGVWLTPLHATANVQRVFIPRPAVENIKPIEVVRPGRLRRVPPTQFQLFGEVADERVKEKG